MSLLINLLTSSVVGTFIFVLLLVIRPISGKLFSKTWHYYSLLVPLIFLLGGTLLAGVFSAIIPMPTYMGYLPTGVAQPQISFAMLANPIYIEPNVVAVQTINAAPYIVSIWAAGAVLFVAINIKKYLNFRRLLFSQARRYSDINCKIPIFVSPSAHTPMLIGIIKPVIVLPQMQFSKKELEIILVHELVHHKRKDLLYKVLGFLANAIHWYNPAAYALNRQLNTLCELSCDEKVAHEMDTTDRKFYGETILQILQHSTMQKDLVFATNLCNSPKNIKRRLTDMMIAKKTKKHILILSLITAMLIFAAGCAVSDIVSTAMPEVQTANELPAEVHAANELPANENKPGNWDEWLEWYNSLTPEQQMYVSLSPPTDDPEPVCAAPVAVNEEDSRAFVHKQSDVFILTDSIIETAADGTVTLRLTRRRVEN